MEREGRQRKEQVKEKGRNGRREEKEKERVERPNPRGTLLHIKARLPGLFLIPPSHANAIRQGGKGPSPEGRTDHFPCSNIYVSRKQLQPGG